MHRYKWGLTIIIMLFAANIAGAAQWERVYPDGSNPSCKDICAMETGGYAILYTNDNVGLLDGEQFTLLPMLDRLPIISSIWAINPECIAVAGYQANSKGWVAIWNGATWQTYSVGYGSDARHIWGSGPSNIFVSGPDGQLHRWDGSEWSELITGTNEDLNDVWGLSKDDVFVLGSNGVLLFWNGTECTILPPFTTAELTCIWGSGFTDIYVGVSPDDMDLYHFNGLKWQGIQMPDPGHVIDIWGSGPDDVYAYAGESIVHFDGTAWRSLGLLQEGFSLSNTKIDGRTAQDLIVVCSKGMLRKQTDGWKIYPAKYRYVIQALAGGAVDNIYALSGDNDLLHWDGNIWSYIAIPNGKITACHMFDNGEMVLSGSKGFATGGQGMWQVIPNQIFSCLDVWGTATDDFFCCGEEGKVFHYDGSGFKFQDTPTRETLTAIWGAGPDDIFAGGGSYDSCTIIHWDGSAWSEQDAPFDNSIVALTGFSSEEVFGINEHGLVVHYNGDEWTEFAELDHFLCDIWGRNSNDLYISRSPDKVHYWNGTEWTSFPGPEHGGEFIIGNATDLFVEGNGRIFRQTATGWEQESDATVTAVCGQPGQPLYAGNLSGDILKRDNGSWQYDSFPFAGSYGDVTDIWVSNSTVVVVGEYGYIKWFDGTCWNDEKWDRSVDFNAVWGSGPSDVYAVGGDQVVHFDGTSWETILDTELPEGSLDFTDVWGIPGHGVYVVGQYSGDGFVIFWDGSIWHVILETEVGLHSAWGTGPTDIHIGSGYDYVYHWDGVSWAEQKLAHSGSFNSIQGVSPTLAFAGGSGHLDEWTGRNWFINRTAPVNGCGCRTLWFFDSQTGYVTEDHSIMKYLPDVCSEIGVTIDMPSDYFDADDYFWIRAHLCNPGPVMQNTAFFVVMDVYGEYYFYPTWCHYPGGCPDADFEIWPVPSGHSTRVIVPEFQWPWRNVGSASGIMVYGAMVDLDNMAILGEMGTWEFGFGYR